MLATSGELLRIDDDSLDTGRNRERLVLDVLTGTTKYRMEQFLFGREFTLGLGNNLTDQNISLRDARSGLDDPVIIEFCENCDG